MLRALAQRIPPWKADAAAVLLMAALGALAYLAEIGPVRRGYEERHARVAQLARQQERSRELEASVVRSAEAVADMRRSLEERSLVLEPRSRLNERLTSICALAGECGLSPDSIEPHGVSAGPLFTTIELRLSGRGKFADCVRFLSRMRREMPHSTLSGVEFSAPPSLTEPTAAFTFHLVWHAGPATAPNK